MSSTLSFVLEVDWNDGSGTLLNLECGVYTSCVALLDNLARWECFNTDKRWGEPYVRYTT